MVSLHVRPASYLKDDLFPTSVSEAFAYLNGYSVRETLSTGRSFWLKFSAPQFTELQGDSLVTDSVDILPGWNMIGSVTVPIPAADIIERPPGLVTSIVYEYRNGYTLADTITPGRGYWVKAGSAGSVVLSSVPFPQAASLRDRPGENLAREIREARIPPENPRGVLPTAPGSRLNGAPGWPGRMNSLTVSDAGGFSQTLYFSSDPPPPGEEWGEMPPPAPANLPDVRFATGRIVEFFDSDAAEFPKPIHASRLRAPVTVSWSVREPGALYMLRGAPGSPVPVSGTGSALLAGGPGEMTLGPEGGSGSAPDAFRLAQNYPNPFNPATTISYILPSPARVRLAVFDNLGREIALLADGEEPAGSRSHEWDAASFASGVYFYRLTVEGTSFTRKMLLLR
jgi:hypothetical protein